MITKVFNLVTFPQVIYNGRSPFSFLSWTNSQSR